MVDSVDKSITEKTTVEVPGADELVQEQQEKIDNRDNIIKINLANASKPKKEKKSDDKQTKG